MASCDPQAENNDHNGTASKVRDCSSHAGAGVVASDQN